MFLQKTYVFEIFVCLETANKQTFFKHSITKSVNCDIVLFYLVLSVMGVERVGLILACLMCDGVL